MFDFHLDPLDIGVIVVDAGNSLRELLARGTGV
jgi:hypothetical protein